MGPYGLSDKINLVKDPAPRCGCSTASLKLRERQRFFEEVFQHDVDATCPRPPIGSISSMEVNEALDVFFSSEGEEGVLTSPLPGMETRNTAEGCEKALRGYTPNGILYLTHRSKETTTTTRSSVMDSFDTSLEVSMPSPASPPRLQTPPLTVRPAMPMEETPPVVRSDDEETHTPAQSSEEAVPPEIERVKSQTPSS
uniref:Uncharacterized protein n=1 Tax=Cyclopterus lumpus TaxID=8103 RepID=A0A8C3G723_CYCLU